MASFTKESRMSTITETTTPMTTIKTMEAECKVMFVMASQCQNIKKTINEAVCDAMTFIPYNTTIARTTTTTKPVCDGIMNAPAASHIGGLVSRHHETSDLDKDSYNFVGGLCSYS